MRLRGIILCGLHLISDFCWNFYLFVSAFARTYLQCTYKPYNSKWFSLRIIVSSSCVFLKRYFPAGILFTTHYWFLNWRAEENLVVNNKDNRVFVSRNYKKIHLYTSTKLKFWKFDVLKISISNLEASIFEKNICFKNITFSRVNYQPIVPRQKHSIVKIESRAHNLIV